MVEFEDLDKELDKEMERVANEVLEEAKKFIRLQDLVHKEILIKSGKVVKKGVLDYDITFDAPHAEAIEFGRLPGAMPPPQALETWVRDKIGANQKKARSIAWAIAKNMKKQGTQPRPFLRPAYTLVLVK